MDKKNTFLGLLFLIIGFGVFIWQAKEAQDYQRERRIWELQNQPQLEDQNSQDPASGDSPGLESLTGLPEGAVTEAPGEAVDTGSIPTAGEKVTLPEYVHPGDTFVLENSFIRVTFTTTGGAIETVEFLKTEPSGGVDPYVFNEGNLVPSHALLFQNARGDVQPFLPQFEVVRHTEDTITFRFITPEGLSLQRTYRVAGEANGQDPYVVSHEVLFENGGENLVSLPQTFLHLGSTASLAYDRQSVGEYLNVSYYTEGDIKYVKARKFIGSNGFLGIGRKEQDQSYREARDVNSLTWASIKNQFFVGILKEVLSDAGGSRARSVRIEAQELEREGEDSWKELGIAGSVGYRFNALQPGERTILGTTFYIGPKEFLRLQNLGQSEERLMQYWGPDIISQALTVFMHGIHKIVPSWGLSIILLTLIIKLFFWPFTSRGMRAQKLNAVKMQPLQAEMKEIREKHKDDPRKMQSAMGELYKKHDINPAAMMGGCIPMLVQIPVFIGLYGMLRVAPEFRFAGLLWMDSLSYPDQFAVLGGFPLNLMPLIYGVVMFFQMRMTPMPETADETQQMTMKMMRWMPAFLVVILYNFAAALFVYFTTNALLTMLQQFLINRKLNPEIEAIKEQQKTGVKVAPAKPAKKKETPVKQESRFSRQQMDGLGATKRLKGGGGSGLPSTPKKRKKRK